MSSQNITPNTAAPILARITRRHWVRAMTMVAGGWKMEAAARGWWMPDESERHQRTWMAFGASERIWGAKLLPEVQRNLATIAQTIARFEPVSMLVREGEAALVKKLLGAKIEVALAPLDDLWMRDTGPVFVRNEQGKTAAVDFNFNGWGGKQSFGHDAHVAQFITDQAGVELRETELVLEGGGIEVDGHGNAIIAESCVLNANRNPGLTKSEFEQEIGPLLGIEHIIWLPGIRDKDITDGHTDFYARFGRPGVVLAGYDPDPRSHDHEVTKEHLRILRAAKDARGRKLEVLTLAGPSRVRAKYETAEFASGYIGFYVCNGAVIGQEFGDPRADARAREILVQAFPGREIVQLNVDGIAAGGGSIHCATQQQPAG